MATTVGLNFRLTAAVENFEKSMGEVNKKLGQIERSSKQTASGIKLLAGIEVGKLLVGGLTKVYGIMKSGVTTLTSWSKEVSQIADAIGKLSASTGVAVEPLQVFQKVALDNGISGDKLGEALKRMTKRLAEAQQGFGEALPALQRLGLNVEDLANMKPEQAFLKIGQAIGNLPQKGQQAAAAFKIFSDQGLSMVPMFKDMEKNIAATSKEMLSLGQILTGSQITAIEKMNNSFNDVFETAKKIGAQALSAFAPAIQKANEHLLDFIKNFQFKGEQGGQAFVKFVVQAFQQGALKLLEWSEGFLKAVKTVAASFLDITSIVLRLVDVINKFFTYVVPLFPVINALVAVVELVLDGINAVLSGLARLFGMLPSSGGSGAGLSDLADELAAASAALKQTEVDFSGLSGTVANIDTNFDGAAQAIHQFEQEAKSIKWSDLTGKVTEVTQAVGSLGQYLPTFEGVAGGAGRALEAISNPANLVRAGMQRLDAGFYNLLGTVGVTRSDVTKFADRVLYAEPFIKRAGEAAGKFSDIVLGGLDRAADFAISGVNSATEAFLDIIKPLGFTKDAIEALGAQANAHKNFKQQLIDSAMSDWDSVAKQRLQYYIKQGANPFAAFHEMYRQRQVALEAVTKKADDAEAAWIKASGGLTGQMNITTDQVKEATGVMVEKIKGVGSSIADGFQVLTDWLGITEGADGLEIPDPIDPRDNIDNVTTAVGRVETALSNFVQAVF